MINFLKVSFSSHWLNDWRINFGLDPRLEHNDGIWTRTTFPQKKSFHQLIDTVALSCFIKQEKTRTFWLNTRLMFKQTKLTKLTKDPRPNRPDRLTRQTRPDRPDGLNKQTNQRDRRRRHRADRRTRQTYQTDGSDRPTKRSDRPERSTSKWVNEILDTII